MFNTLAISPKKLIECPFHSHRDWEIVINLEGEGETVIDGISYPFEPGTIVCIPPHMEHRKISKNGFEDIYFHTDYIPLVYDKKPDINKPLILQDDAAKSFETLARLMLRTHTQEVPNKKMLVNSMYDVANQILVSLSAKKKVDPEVERIQDILLRNFADSEMNISELLESSCYSVDHMRRIFYKELGMTPSKYLKKIRIDYAKKLLYQNRNLGLSMSEIGSMCGYYDERYFSKMFRSETGMSPSAYIFYCENNEYPNFRIRIDNI